MQKLGISLYPHKNQIIQDAYDGLITHIYSCESIPKTLCITSNSPGAGKTTISINLAISFAMAGRKVLLIDTDIRKDQKYKRLGTDKFLGLSDFLVEEEELDEVLTHTNISKLVLITSGKIKIKNPLGLLYSPRFDSLMTSTIERFDIVIIDTSSLDVNADSSVIASKADATMLVVEINDSAKTLERNMERLNAVNANIIGTILNKIPKYEYRTHMEYYNYKHTGIRRKIGLLRK
jgi:capsular exopolysaccharide synthesis family protein